MKKNSIKERAKKNSPKVKKLVKEENKLVNHGYETCRRQVIECIKKYNITESRNTDNFNTKLIIIHTCACIIKDIKKLK